MSYYIKQIDSSFFMPKENFAQAVAAAKEQIPVNYFGKIPSIETVLNEYYFQIDVDEQGNIIDIHYTGERSNAIDEIFPVIAPFVKAGSYFDFTGEDGCIYRGLFDGQTYTEKKAKIVLD